MTDKVANFKTKLIDYKSLIRDFTTKMRLNEDLLNSYQNEIGELKQ